MLFTPRHGRARQSAPRSLRWRRFGVVAALLFSVLPAGGVEVDYLREIKPILTHRCVACHGPLRQQAGLRLDTAALAIKGGDEGPAIVRGKPDESALIDALLGRHGRSRMPAEGEPLSPAQVELLRRWIAAGAKAPPETPEPDPREHWSFRPLVKPKVPILTERSVDRTGDVGRPSQRGDKTSPSDDRGARADRSPSERDPLQRAAAQPSPSRGQGSDGTGRQTPSEPASLHPIDAFLEVKRRELGLIALPEADRLTLLRRVSIDLIGIPPTSSEMADFLADARPDAWERVVDRLLASPLYAERWGRHWMDVWRYSDWAGFAAEHRESQKHIWRWRDWIVDSLAADKPYDRMIQEMLAADELAPTDPAALRATAYLGRNWYKFNRHVTLDNTVEHTAKAFLGLTLNCARCHDHMYDPIAQRDHYAFRAFFEPHETRLDRVGSTTNLEADGLARVFDGKPAEPTWLFRRGNDKDPDKSKPIAPAPPALLSAKPPPVEPVPLPAAAWYPDLRDEVCTAMLTEARSAEKVATEAASKLGPIASPANSAGDPAAPLARAEVALASARVKALEARIAAERHRHLVAKPDPARLSELTKQAALAERAVAKADAERQLALARMALKEAASRPDLAAVKQALADAQAKLAQAEKQLADATAAAAKPLDAYAPLGPQYPKESTGRRLALARWITAADNPLTARVAVNHLWMRHFGQPLVTTVFDFGRNGRPPSHPELLDWLAASFRDGGWRMKPIHRLMVTSKAYRLASTPPGSDASSSSGTMAQPLRLDPDNLRYWRANPRRLEAEAVRDSVLALDGRLDLTRGGPDLDHGAGLNTFRRSLYYRHANEKQMLFLETFDAAGVTECYRRNESIAPQQALALANSELTRGAGPLIERKLTELTKAAPAVPASAAKGIERPKALGESAADDSFLTAAWRLLLARDPRPEEITASRMFLAETPPPGQSQRARLIHVLLNHHDFITVR
jgi:mono/diheme cytochrome c family protein